MVYIDISIIFLIKSSHRLKVHAIKTHINLEVQCTNLYFWVLILRKKLSKYSLSLDLHVSFMTPNIFCCCRWEQPQWRTLTQRPPEQGHAMLEEDPPVWICLSLPMWAWPRLRHPCVAFCPTSASNWLQTNRDHDHSLFIDRLLSCFTPVQLRHICLCCLTTSPCRLKRPHCETFIEVYFSKWAP